MTGSLPHSPQMVKALTNYQQNSDGTFRPTGVAENRIAPFIMYDCLSKLNTFGSADSNAAYTAHLEHADH
eukprot:COSAG02_NODE_699_length_18369_cov_9.690203_4_plen_70_part_00